MMVPQRKMWKLEDLSRKQEALPKNKRFERTKKRNASGTKKGAERQEEIQRTFEGFKGIRNILGIKSARRRVLITKIKNEKGEVITSRKGIANVFGELNKNFTMTKNTDMEDRLAAHDVRVTETDDGARREPFFLATVEMFIANVNAQKWCEVDGGEEDQGRIAKMWFSCR